MPELPEVEALAAFLRERAVGRAVARVDVVAVSALKTFDPPVTALAGLTVTGAARHGKFLDLDCDGLHLVVHLARAGWLHWRDNVTDAPVKRGGPIAARIYISDPATPNPHCADLTEQGTKKGLAIYVVRDPRDVPGVARLGPDALAIDLLAFRDLLARQRSQLKGVLTDQTALAGIGNAYSDEILHLARLSPFAIAARLAGPDVDRLYDAMRQTLTDAVRRSTGQQAATLKSEKRSGLRVHARTGLPCPVCGDTVREVSFADRSLQYCPTCQTGGKPLADRRLSKLLR
ncbi:MAG TPA: DNA-formamidopyrimidine glycosylase family protein [Mycobacteriales bacterium]|nr:DNA-formamidopyrimidine glycosylase family protein [Mycobacteriales bacterium]